MFRFWATLWFRWALWLTVASLAGAAILTFVATAGLYFLNGAPSLESDVRGALADLARFGFPLSWSLSVLGAFYASVPKLFGHCASGFRLALYDCDGETEIERPGVADTAKLWRKWLFVIIWLAAAQTLVAALAFRLAGAEGGVMAWFSAAWLYLFVLIAALASLPVMGARCTMVRIVRC